LVWVPFLFPSLPLEFLCVFCMRKDNNYSSSSCCSILTFPMIFMPSFIAQLTGHSPCAPLMLTITFPTSFMQGNMLFMLHSINCNVTTLAHAHSIIAYP
jgi:hypothetical protein